MSIKSTRIITQNFARLFEAWHFRIRNITELKSTLIRFKRFTREKRENVLWQTHFKLSRVSIYIRIQLQLKTFLVCVCVSACSCVLRSRHIIIYMHSFYYCLALQSYCYCGQCPSYVMYICKPSVGLHRCLSHK